MRPHKWACPMLGGRVPVEVTNQIIATSIKNQPIKGLQNLPFYISIIALISRCLKRKKQKNLKKF